MSNNNSSHKILSSIGKGIHSQKANSKVRSYSYSVLRSGGLPKFKRLLRARQWFCKRERRASSFTPLRVNKRSRIKPVVWVSLSLACVSFFTLDGENKIRDFLSSIHMFQVTKCEITGNLTVEKKAIQDAAEIVLHQSSLLGIDLDDIKTRIVSIPWIKDVEITRDWPDAVYIKVRENIPLALIHNDNEPEQQLHYIDEKGVAFLPVSPGGNVDFPVVTGLFGITDEELRQKALRDVLVLLQKVRRNDPHLPAHSLSEIHVDAAGELVVYLVDYPFPIFFGNRDTEQQYSRLVDVLKVLYKKNKGKSLISGIEYIQMDYSQDKVLIAQTDIE